MPELAAEWGVRRVVVKDESARLGLPAFKALGVFYAVHRVLSDRAGRPLDDLAALRAAAQSQPLELVTATDGNHGRALAHVAGMLGLPCRVFVPDVVAPGAIESIRGEGAEVVVVPEDYDKAVALAAEDAENRADAVLVQDTAWPGYKEIPQYIVDGYSTMFAEVDEQLGGDAASLVVTPMGVGSLAQAVLTHYKSRGRAVTVLGVEPDTAACVRVQPARRPPAQRGDRNHGHGRAQLRHAVVAGLAVAARRAGRHHRGVRRAGGRGRGGAGGPRSAGRALRCRVRARRPVAARRRRRPRTPRTHPRLGRRAAEHRGVPRTADDDRGSVDRSGRSGQRAGSGGGAAPPAARPPAAVEQLRVADAPRHHPRGEQQLRPF